MPRQLLMVSGAVLLLLILIGISVGPKGTAIRISDNRGEEITTFSMKNRNNEENKQVETVNVQFPDSAPSAEEGKDNKEITPVKPVKSIPVIYYHSVDRVLGNELCVPPEELNSEMEYLYRNGYHAISLTQLYKFLYGGGDHLPEKPIVITFDDGYKDNFTNALPILKKYDFTATVFMITAEIGNGSYLSWDQLKELTLYGWQVESHTITHPKLSELNMEKLKLEVENSKLTLEQGLGHVVNYLAYPYGDYDERVIKAVKEAGYLMAFTTQKGWASRESDPMLIHRVYCYAGMGLTKFARRVNNPAY